MTTLTAVIPPVPSWIVWDELEASEQDKLTQMWDAWVDDWLDVSIATLDTEPADRDYSVSWDGRHTFVNRAQLAQLRQLPAGAERRERLYRILAEGPGDSSQ